MRRSKAGLAAIGCLMFCSAMQSVAADPLRDLAMPPDSGLQQLRELNQLSLGATRRIARAHAGIVQLEPAEKKEVVDEARRKLAMALQGQSSLENRLLLLDEATPVLRHPGRAATDVDQVGTRLAAQAMQVAADLAFERLDQQRDEAARQIVGTALNQFTRAGGQIASVQQALREGEYGTAKALDILRAVAPTEELIPDEVTSWPIGEAVLYAATIKRALGSNLDQIPVRDLPPAMVEMLRGQIRRIGGAQLSYVTREAELAIGVIDSATALVAAAAGSLNPGSMDPTNFPQIDNQAAALFRDGFLGGSAIPKTDAGVPTAPSIARGLAQNDSMRLINQAGAAINGASLLVDAAENFGLDVDDNVKKAVDIGNVALTAFAAYSSGNFPAAISAVAGVFGGGMGGGMGGDVGASKRQAKIMAQFQIVNQKLDRIDSKLENVQLYLDKIVKQIDDSTGKILTSQVELRNQISQLSNKIDEHQAKLLSEFETVEFLVTNVIKKIEAEQFSGAENCRTILSDLGAPRSDPRTKSKEEYKEWIYIKQTPIKDCLDGLQKLVDVGGKFLSISSEEIAAQPVSDFRTWYEGPYRALIQAAIYQALPKLTAEQRSPAALSALSRPVANITALDDKWKLYDDTGSSIAFDNYGLPKQLPNRLRSLLWGDLKVKVPELKEILGQAQQGPHNAAKQVENLLTDFKSPRLALRYFDYLASLFMLYGDVSSDGKLSETPDREREILAAQLLLNAITWLDVIIAQQNALSGDILLPYIYSQIIMNDISGNQDFTPVAMKTCDNVGMSSNEIQTCHYQEALSILLGIPKQNITAGALMESYRANEFLVENFGRFVVARGLERGQQELAYAVALRSDRPDMLGLLLGKGKQLQWVPSSAHGDCKTPSGWCLALPGPGEKAKQILIPLPTADIAASDALAIPPVLTELVTLRERLATALMEYEPVIASLSSDQASETVAAMRYAVIVDAILP